MNNETKQGAPALLALWKLTEATQDIGKAYEEALAALEESNAANVKLVESLKKTTGLLTEFGFRFKPAVMQAEDILKKYK
jgi:hypothetical protein